MDDTLIAMLIGFIGMVYIIARQQQSIDKLTDKLMAKDYNEYMRHEADDTMDDRPKRKPLSYFDDGGDEEEIH